MMISGACETLLEVELYEHFKQRFACALNMFYLKGCEVPYSLRGCDPHKAIRFPLHAFL